MLSNAAFAEAFTQSLQSHKDSIHTLDNEAVPIDPEVFDEPLNEEGAAPTVQAVDVQTQQSFLLDWTALALIVAACLAAITWLGTNRITIARMFSTPAIEVATPVQAEAHPLPVHKVLTKAHRHRHRTRNRHHRTQA